MHELDIGLRHSAVVTNVMQALTDVSSIPPPPPAPPLPASWKKPNPIVSHSSPMPASSVKRRVIPPRSSSTPSTARNSATITQFAIGMCFLV